MAMSQRRCEYCEKIMACPQCGLPIESFNHVGVRATGAKGSSIWHYASPCGHRIQVEVGGTHHESTTLGTKLAVYKGGPLWQNGYLWFNVFWGSYWVGQQMVDMLNKATQDIETNQSFSGELKQYNVGIGTLNGHAMIQQNPPSSVSENEIGSFISTWIQKSLIPDLKGKGAYNIFLPPGITALLGTDKSCVVFCDYHDTANGNSGPFFTVEPYPCGTGCNQCDSNPFDTITQGLSEEMIELKTDMNPGTGWVIGNEEICDYCDKNFVCNKISTGEYVNSWYSDSRGACWTP